MSWVLGGPQRAGEARGHAARPRGHGYHAEAEWLASLGHRNRAIANLPGVLHEEAVDHHSARQGPHGRLHLPLLPGEPPRAFLVLWPPGATSLAVL